MCGFSKFKRGKVISDKNSRSVIKAIHEAWCMNIGYPTEGFWADNGREFQNMKMEKIVNKLGFKIDLHQLFPHGLTV